MIAHRLHAPLVHVLLVLVASIGAGLLPSAAVADPVRIETLLSVSGPIASADTQWRVLRGGEEIAAGDGPVAELDLEPGRYTVEARSGLAEREERIRVRNGASREQRVTVNLRAGILALRSRSGRRAVLAEAEPDVFGDQIVLAEIESEARLDWALVVPQGTYQLVVEGDEGRIILNQDVEIVPARRERITTR